MFSFSSDLFYYAQNKFWNISIFGCPYFALSGYSPFIFRDSRWEFGLEIRLSSAVEMPDDL